MSTTNHSPVHEYFTPLGFNVCLTEGDSWPRGLYSVDPIAAKWDGTEKRFAIYSEQHGVYSYCTVRITGRGVRFNHNYRVTVRVDFDGESSQNHSAILLRPDGSRFSLDEARELVK